MDVTFIFSNFFSRRSVIYDVFGKLVCKEDKIYRNSNVQCFFLATQVYMSHESFEGKRFYGGKSDGDGDENVWGSNCLS